MFTKDSFVLGLIIGLILPVMGFFTLDEINLWAREHYFVSGSKGISLQLRAIISVILNLLPFLWFVRDKRDNSMRGIMLPTFLYAVGIMIYFFGSDLF